MRYNSAIYINKREISLTAPTYFIADVASSHDGDLDRAKELIWLAREAGADAVKFQHFLAKGIVSDFGFKQLGGQMGHQATWKKSVYEIYQQYECNREWTETLAATAAQAGIHFMTTPYDAEAVKIMAAHVPAFKIGSGDITWHEIIELVARQGKPVLLASGAATFEEVCAAVEAALKHTQDFVLLQCNTNYTASLENFRFINLNVLKSYAVKYPGMLLGLSDHTPGPATVLGAIAMGARVIEKHFTDDNSREGPDHPFSMNPVTWKDMVERSRELEQALGDGYKRIEENETETAVLQRRCLRIKRNMAAGDLISETDLEALRPAPKGALAPYQVREVVNRKLACTKVAGDAIYWSDLEGSSC